MQRSFAVTIKNVPSARTLLPLSPDQSSPLRLLYSALTISLLLYRLFPHSAQRPRHTLILLLRSFRRSPQAYQQLVALIDILVGYGVEVLDTRIHYKARTVEGRGLPVRHGLCEVGFLRCGKGKDVVGIGRGAF